MLALDLHAAQIQGFFNIPVDHLFAAPVFIDYLASADLPDPVVVSPDAGGVERARAYAKRLGRRPGHHRQAPRRAERRPSSCTSSAT